MKSKIFVILIMVLLVVSSGAPATRVEAESPASLTTIYVVPPITDVKILPTSVISNGYISDEISIIASPGEYEPASFVIHADEDITSLEVQATDLTGPGGSIASDNVDIRVVKVWYQAGVEVWDPDVDKGLKVFTPELLLKDNSLVKVENEENYVKLTTGDYVWISEVDWLGASYDKVIPIEDLPVEDSASLQPVDIPGGTNKQFWVTIEVPNDAEAGIYTGNISLTAPGVSEEIQLKLEVLPIELAEPYLTYSIYWRPKLRDTGSISSGERNAVEMVNELTDMLEHGISNPQIRGWQSPDWSELKEKFESILQFRQSVGMPNTIIYFHAPLDLYGTDWDVFKSRIQELKDLSAPYGMTEFYWYGIDETPDPDSMRPGIAEVHEAGAKVFCALSNSNAALVADVLDTVIAAGDPDASLAATYHSYGHEILSYGNPQVGLEKPETYRRNYGLLLWQRDYDGAMNFAYDWACGNIWNDFDHAVHRDHNFVYPTINGVIDTIQWEGQREGVDDIRYLTTLLNTIETAKGGGKDTSSAESWLADLKSSDLTTKALDAVRLEMIYNILSLGDILDTTPPIISQVTPLEIASNTARITWKTDDLSTSQVEYGKTEDLGSSTLLDTKLVTSHNAILNDLDSSTIYYYRVKSKDIFSNLAISDIYSFTTPSPYISISLISPTDENNAVVDRNWTEINTLVESNPSEASSFIDWNRSLVGYWNFNEDSYSTANDKSTFGNNGTLVNGLQRTTGKFGLALEFNGDDDYVEIAHDESLDITNEITVEAWFKTATKNLPNNHRMIFTFKGPTYLSLVTDNSANIFLSLYIDGYQRTLNSLFSPSINTWYHVVGTWDGSIMRIYVNGELKNSAGPFTGSLDTGTGNKYIGRYVSAGYEFNGLIDEVRIWNRALSPEEIRASYSTTIYGLSHTFTDLADGTYEYHAYATDTTGISAQTETRTITIETNLSSYIPGDANEDGDVNSLDITKVKRIIMGLDDPTPGADANGDGNINALDITQIELIIMGS